MIRLALGLAIVVAGASGGASAQSIIGAGAEKSCGEWLRVRPFEDRLDNFRERAAIYQMQSWLHGFVSGYNVASGGPDFLAAQPGFVAQAAWVDNYCRSNPLDVLGQAALALTKELRSRGERK